MQIDTKFIRLLMQIGFMAADKPDSANAETIFQGILANRPESVYPHIGKAYTVMNMGQFDKAVTMLRNAPCQDIQEKELCNGFLAMALKLSGYNEEAKRIIDDIKANGTNPVAVDMAAKLLETDLSAEMRAY